MEAKKKVIVGLFVGGTLLLFALGLFLIGNSTQLFTRSFVVSADFSKVTGLEVGTKVRVGGMDAGAITLIAVPSQPDGRFNVRFRIIEKLHALVRQDSVATIQTDGLLGNKFLEIDAGSDNSARAKNGSAIQAKEPFDWGDLMQQASGTVKLVNTALVNINDIAETADHLVKSAAPDLTGILDSSNKVATNIRQITDGIQEGHGAVGVLLNDKGLADNLTHTVSDARVSAQNLRETTDRANRIVAKFDDSNIMPEVQQSVKNLQQITAQVKDAVDKFQPASGDSGVGENLQKTVADAQEAMSDLSEDTEALKHNFLFRGFFKDRGFYDLASVGVPEYKEGKFAKGFQRHPVWLESAALFSTDSTGVEALSAPGKKKLDEAMTDILQFPRNGPLMVEGYSGVGSASQQYLSARRRAVLVQSYLTYRFHLRPAYVGIVAMGALPQESGVGGPSLEGVRLVSFFKK
jgi:phospholipid/cholesterol/gamma-HCH transport system substrate-binding protein